MKSNNEVTDEISLEKEFEAERIWIENTNKEAGIKAEELERALKVKVKPVVFIVDAQKRDVAVGFLKHPDAIQSLKILRSMGANYENGIALVVRAQLIRTHTDEEGEKIVSDPRFMDADGNYDQVNCSELNFSLMLSAQEFITSMQNQFKKK